MDDRELVSRLWDARTQAVASILQLYSQKNSFPWDELHLPISFSVSAYRPLVILAREKQRFLRDLRGFWLYCFTRVATAQSGYGDRYALEEVVRKGYPVPKEILTQSGT